MLARQGSVPGNPVLARALYFTSEIGGEIAEGLYNAVAVILVYVFRIDSEEAMEILDLTLPPELALMNMVIWKTARHRREMGNGT